MILQVINWKTLSSNLKIIALTVHLEDNVNQIHISCCEVEVLYGWFIL